MIEIHRGWAATRARSAQAAESEPSWQPLALSAGPSKPPPSWDHESEGELKEQLRTERPRKYKVLFHNDDYTTMEFVVETLRRFFHKNDTEALHIMLTVHTKGNAVAGVYSREVAETKVAQVTDHAKQHGMPLLVTAEPE